MTTFTSKHSTPQRKEPPSQQINSLYHQFESLKSQIYNSKSNRKNTNFPRKWDNQQNYYDAQSVLRESTIRKYSKEFKEQLQQIKESRKQHHQKQPVEVNNQLFTELDSSPQQHDKRRKKEEKWMNMFSLFKQKINVEEQRQHEGVDVLSTVLLNYKNSKENIQRSGIDQELASEIIGNALKQYQNYQNGLLYIMADRLNFFSKKMNCLQRIISECSKIIKLSNQNKRSKQLSEHILLINLKTLETKYETEIKRLVKHYEDKITQLNKQNKNKNSSQKDSEGWKGQEEENSQLKLILQQTKKLLVTKEEIITSLQQQNGQLKRQILKINQQKQEFSLGYSLTGRKLKVSTQKMNSSEPEKLKEEDLHEHEEDINFNELESVKEKSFEEWDISHLEMRHNTNTKSMAGDFKEIYENEVDQYS